jgi:hypothetical protein
MITTANLGLTVWDNEEDDFEHSQLADNFVRIDAHSHVGGLSESLNSQDELEGDGHWTNIGLGLAIKTSAIEPEAIWRYLLKLRSVASKQIDIEGVESENIAEHNVLNKHLANESVNDRTIQEETITIDKLDPNILTLGSVMLWYKYTPSATPGDIWHLCDGTSWASIPNNLGLSTGFIPDLRERFVRGTDINHTGEVGGNASINLAHSHNVAASSLEHRHTIGSHNHSISTQGAHNHGFGNHNTESGSEVYTPRQIYVESNITPGERDALAMNVPELGEEELLMQTTGNHNHGGSTGLNPAYATGGSSLSGSVGTDVQLVDINVTPPFVGLCYIMRVK